MPEKMEGFRQELLEMLQADTDFQAVFAGLGHSISEGKPVTQTLGTLWTDVFGGGTVTASSPAALTENRLYQAESVFLNGYEGGQTPGAALAAMDAGAVKFRIGTRTCAHACANSHANPCAGAGSPGCGACGVYRPGASGQCYHGQI